MGNIVYQFVALRFVPKSAPRTFTKVVVVVTAYLRRQSLRLAVYLDDWLGLKASRQRLLEELSKMIELLLELGFIINANKSLLVPT